MGVTLKDVAERAGVSVPTASRVLSGSSYPVVEELRARVQAAATELDYVPNAQAQGLSRGTTGTIGVLVGDVGDPYFSEIVNGVHELATARHLLVSICHTQRDPDSELAYFRLLQAHRARAVILGGSGLSDETYRAGLDARVRSFQEMGGSVVAIGTPVVDVDHVLADNRVGAERLGHYLADLGHRDVAVISGPENVASSVERTEGLRAALERNGARIHVHHGPPTRDEGYRATGEILHRFPEITAIVGTADQMAIGASARIRAQGLQVPAHISVAGFNDISLAADLAPSLTTVRLPLRDMGRTALELALMAPTGDTVEHTFGVELVVRESTGRAPTN